jgi:hypothetical protein
MTPELLQQVLDALETIYDAAPCDSTRYELVGSIRAHLAAQPAEPVAWLCENAAGHKYFRWKKPMSEYKPKPLYTHPPTAPVRHEEFSCPYCFDQPAPVPLTDERASLEGGVMTSREAFEAWWIEYRGFDDQTDKPAMWLAWQAAAAAAGDKP